MDTIVYVITKGKKHKVTDVSVAGNSQLKTPDLMALVTVKKSHLFSPGNYSEQLVRASTKNLTALYQSEGFSSAQVTSVGEPQGRQPDGGLPRSRGAAGYCELAQDRGRRHFPGIEIRTRRSEACAGKPYSQKLVEADRASIVAHYLQAGYLTSSFRETANVVSKNDPHHINVVYHIYEGPQVHTRDVLTLGRVRTQQRLIDRDVATIVPNQPLTETAAAHFGEQALQPHWSLRLGGSGSPAADNDADQ